MAEYYLISQLPSLDGLSENTPVPITEERYLDLCRRFLGNKAMREIENLTLVPSIDPAGSSSALITAWNEGERDLRLALGKVRAEKMGRSFDLQSKSLPQDLYKTAAAAVEINDPLEAEKFLLNYRLSFLDTLRPTDPFSEEFVFYYALKLKLILRIREFDAAEGEATYQSIYHSILNGNRLEA
ncbi:MAG: DUF2764 family protein [Clostridia bacterium]|nr:DUF2764 family protein [Clostridia bacterium]MBR0025776.1 DUF2764 family protein [Clostridia bacterium]